MMIWGLVSTTAVDVAVVGFRVLPRDGDTRPRRSPARATAAVSSWVDSGLLAHSATWRARCHVAPA